MAAPPDADSKPTTLAVRLVDMDGKPIEGAGLSTFSGFSAHSKNFAPDETGWSYYPKVVSDRDGMARIADDDGITVIISRHVVKTLVAIQPISPEQAKGQVTVTMYPQCKVFGRLISKELESRHGNFTWSNVYLHLTNERLRPMACQSKKGKFHFYVPPGTYKLEAYSTETHRRGRRSRSSRDSRRWKSIRWICGPRV